MSATQSDALPPRYWGLCKAYLRNSYGLLRDKRKRYHHHPHRYRWIVEKLRGFDPIPSTVLDVGCLDGYGVEIMKEAGFQVYGVDIYSKALNGALTKDIGKVSADHLAFKDKAFDVVVSTGVLEHIHESGVKQVISELDRVGKRNVHRIHMKGFGRYWAKGYHVTVKELSFWENLVDEIGASDRWVIVHDP